MSSLADWLSAISTALAALAACYAAYVGVATLKRQRTTSDIELALSIFAEINRYWDRITDSSTTYDYNMGQILTQFEIASALFNKNSLTSDATTILGDHIVEVFTLIRSTDQGAGLLSRCCSSGSTYCELQTFVRNRMPQALATLEFQAGKHTKLVGE